MSEKQFLFGYVPLTRLTSSIILVISIRKTIMSEYFFTSESVVKGHLGKLADPLLYNMFGAILEQDSTSLVAFETLANTRLISLASQITTAANEDFIEVASEKINPDGFDNSEYGIDYTVCTVLVSYNKQSPDIAQGVDGAHDDQLRYS